LLLVELRRRRSRRELLRTLLWIRLMVVLIGVLLVRLADSLCLCLGLNLLESILCLFASFIEEIHNCHQSLLKIVIFRGSLPLLLSRGQLCSRRINYWKDAGSAAHVTVSPGIFSRNGSRVCCQELMKWQTVQWNNVEAISSISAYCNATL
jgi:hypothetical protein